MRLRLRYAIVTGAILFSQLPKLAHASLTINLQFADGTTSHQLSSADVGNVIPIDVWATVTTSTPISANNHDGLQFVYFDVLSSLPLGGPGSPGGSTAVDGQLGSVALTPLFGGSLFGNGAGAQPGTLMDANGDGVIDLGPDTSPNQSNSTQQLLQFAKPRSDPPGIWDNAASFYPGVVISPDKLSISFLVEQLNFQVNSTSGLETVYTPLGPAVSQPYVAANWFEDDPTIPSGNQGAGAQYTEIGPVLGGTGVTFFGTGASVPEPACLGGAVVAGAGLLRRRKFIVRH